MKAFVLGGTSLVALETCKLLIKDGWEVTVSVRSKEKSDQVILKLGDSNDIVITYFDALNPESYLSQLQSKASNYDAVFCFIGYLPNEINEHTSQDIQDIYDVNLTSLVKVINVFAISFSLKQKGTIVGISSVAGDRGKSKNMLYSSAKAGFTAYLSGLRNQLFTKNVHVLTVIPGYMETAMTEDIELSKHLTVKPDTAAQLIYRAFKKKKNTVYITWKWKIIMGLIKMVPESLYKRMGL